MAPDGRSTGAPIPAKSPLTTSLSAGKARAISSIKCGSAAIAAAGPIKIASRAGPGIDSFVSLADRRAASLCTSHPRAVAMGSNSVLKDDIVSRLLS